MTVRRFSIRDIVTAVVAVCTLGGLALSLGLAFAFQSFELEARGLGESSLTLQEVGTLRRDISSWFAVVDESLERAGTHADEARARAREIRLDLRALETRPLAQPHRRDLEALALRVEAIEKGIDIASSLPREGADRDQKLAEIRSGVELLSGSLDKALDRFEGALRERVTFLSDAVASKRGWLWKLALLGALVYFSLVFVLWRWTIRNIAWPLLKLTAEARHCLSKRAHFRLAPAGPLEVRRLTDSVSTLVSDLQGSRNNLEDKVLERTAELEEANRAKNEFLAKVTHEIRTPMTSILGYAELCRRPDTTEDERSEYLHTISVNGEHLVDVINDILDIARIEAGRMRVESTECSLPRILQEVANLMRVQAREKGLRLRIAYRDPVPDPIRTDPTRLRQILINLVSNAIKFTDEGEVSMTVVSEDFAGRELLGVRIEDTGAGMSEEQLRVAFEPFVQGDDSYSREHGGTGLGLSISRALAQLLGGDVVGESLSGGGTAFTLIFDPGPLEGVPRVAPDAALATVNPVEELAAALPSLRGRALLAEDVPLNRKLVATMLGRAGLAVDEAENGREAHDMALAARGRGEPYDVVVMDMQMPEVDGYEATRRLRADGYRGPILALTAHSLDEDRQRCLEAGCDEYATKPVKEEDLSRLLGRIMEASGQSARPEPAG